MSTPTITTKIKEKYPTLSRTQKVFADFVLSDPVKMASVSIHVAVEEAGVSSATANRFVRSVGYKNYASFRADLIQNLGAAYEPVYRLRQDMSQKMSADGIVANILREDIENLAETIGSVEPATWRAAVDAIRKARRIFVNGFDNGAALAQILANGLLRINPHVHAVSGGSGGFAGLRHIVGMDGRDLVIAIAFPRYIKDTVRLAALARSRGVPVLSITDSHRSPLAAIGDVNLYIAARRQFGTVSNAAILAVIESLLGAVLHAHPATIRHAEAFAELTLPWIESP
ncbi:MurR/RpiR family transcriptional regulator [uncultured Bosea sp.]|uniref:MurR/RpiR family transcriptional regulator n=1 Tax=uncultured Bosea sp. TaxID=211457 RepID=UPI0025DA6114|nr:MurR/RpiR family transcriptional regulator [uncultured Bosea sp.]